MIRIDSFKFIHAPCILLLSVLLVLCLNRTGKAAGWLSVESLEISRFGHTSTLLPDGRVLVVAGGGASAEIYDRATRKWTRASDMVNSRRYHGAVLLLDGRVLVTGGLYDGYTLSSVELYDPVINTWSSAKSMASFREDHSVTLMSDGKVLVAGGYGGGASAELYDPVSNTWSSGGSMQIARSNHTATLLRTGRVLVVGGTGGVLSAELYDPTTNSWSSAGNMGTERNQHTATLLPDGRVLVVGGVGGGSSAELYDPVANTWSNASSMTGARASHTATLLPNGRVLVAGGSVSSVELYDPVADKWISGDSMTKARSSHTATLLPSGRVLVVGGTDSSAELYDPASIVWAATGSMADNRESHTATLLSNGKVLVAGGEGGEGLLNSSELFDPAYNTWSSAGTMTVARSFHTATLLPDGRVLVAGGLGGGSSAEIYNPIENTWSNADDMAESRSFHTATLLPDGSVLVTGGTGGGSSAEFYDPATNNWINTQHMNIERKRHTATLLLDGNVLVAGGSFIDPLFSAELYDSTSQTWSRAGNMYFGRDSHTATLLENGMVLVTSGGEYGIPYVLSSELYNPSSKTWSDAGSFATARSMHTATLLQNGMVMVTGGRNNLFNAELYSPASNSWSTGGTVAEARTMSAATLLPNGKVLVTGGASLPSAELFVTDLGYDESWRPVVEPLSSPVYLNLPVNLVGTGFRGYGNAEASSGESKSSATNFPLVQIRNADSSQSQWLVPEHFSAASYISQPLDDFPTGPAWFTVYVNGIPSIAQYVLVEPSFTISASPGPNGSLDAETPSPQIVPNGSSVQFTFNADPNHHVLSIVGCGINYVNLNNFVTSKSVATDTITAANTPCSVTAVFVPDAYDLSVTVTGTGNGLVSSDPSSIACGSGVCTESFSFGKTVLLTADSSEDSTFSGWTGDCTATDDPYVATVVIDNDNSCTATFTSNTHMLYMAKDIGNDCVDGGLIVRDPGMYCSKGCTESNLELDNLEPAQLLAVPDVDGGFLFDSWSGDCTGSQDICELIMDDHKNVTACFRIDPDFAEPNPKAIIVAGSGPEDVLLWGRIKENAQNAYKALRNQGYPKANIALLSAEYFDADGDGDDTNDVTNVATPGALQTAISEASDADSFVLYLVGHGAGSGYYTIQRGSSGAEDENVSATELDGWLDDLQNIMTGHVIVIYEACYAGSFVPYLAPAVGRYIIASSLADEKSWLEANGTSFGWNFWANVNFGDELWKAFSDADARMPKQTAALDSSWNGVEYVQTNGVPNQVGDPDPTERDLFPDGFKIGSGFGLSSSDYIPVITDFNAPPMAPKGSAELLWAEVYSPSTWPINNVWAVIVPPDYDPFGPVRYNELQVVDLLDSNGDMRFEGTYQFDKGGEYSVVFYATNSKGDENNTAVPRQATVITPGSFPWMFLTPILEAGREN